MRDCLGRGSVCNSKCLNQLLGGMFELYWGNEPQETGRDSLCPPQPEKLAASSTTSRTGHRKHPGMCWVGSKAQGEKTPASSMLFAFPIPCTWGWPKASPLLKSGLGTAGAGSWLQVSPISWGDKAAAVNHSITDQNHPPLCQLVRTWSRAAAVKVLVPAEAGMLPGGTTGAPQSALLLAKTAGKQEEAERRHLERGTG